MSGIRTRVVPDEIRNVLQTVRFYADTARIPDQLPRPTYVALNKVLVAAGGKWNRRRGAHVWSSGDALAALEPILLTGRYHTDADFGFFETPKPVADLMMTRAFHDAPVRRGRVPWNVLEPSAGTGNLVCRLAEARVRQIDCYELRKETWEKLVDRVRDKSNIDCFCNDFLAVPPDPRYDLVAMNPPFSGRADIRHIRHAMEFLKPGGRLVAVAAAGLKFRADHEAVALRKQVEALGGTIEDLPPNSFKSAGTAVNAVLITLDTEA